MKPTTVPLQTKRLVAALCGALSLSGAAAVHAATVAVTSCADDGSPESLRGAVARAASGDVIDLSELDCSPSGITLTQGEIVVPHNATIVGPAHHTLTVSGVNARVFDSTSDDSPEAYLTIVNLTVAGGHIYASADGAYGGCIRAQGEVDLIGSTISHCVANTMSGIAQGGAVSAATVALTNSVLNANAAIAQGPWGAAQGGAVFANELNCSNSTISGNMASVLPQSNSFGGGAWVGENLTLSRCTIDSNSASIGGGVAKFEARHSQGSTHVEDSTISGNIALNQSGGIYVFCAECLPATVNVYNSTIAFNSAGGGYGVGLATNGAVVAQSTIVSNNFSNQAEQYVELYAGDLSGADNLVRSTNATPLPGVITVLDDPVLLPLAFNGGTTRTHALVFNSPARYQGNNVEGHDSDQRGNGYSRYCEGMVDIGAFQTQQALDHIMSSSFED